MMTNILLLAFGVFMLGWVFRHNVQRSNRAVRQKNKSFWERESRANTVRRADIEHLEYIKISLDALPFGVYSSDGNKYLSVRDYENKIKKLSDTKILNLNGLTNTDLKEEYGVANLSFLSDCDARFIELVRTLNQWATAISESNPDASIQIQQYAVSVGSDVTNTFVMLASHYKKQNNIQNINDLIETASLLRSANKERIINKLNDIKSLT